MLDDRNRLLLMEPEQLIRLCEFSAQRRSGKGGQKINKTASAVRLTHGGSGISVIASESRYQAENRSIAIKKMKRQIALQIRNPAEAMAIQDDELPSLKNPVYPLWMARLLDVVEEKSYSTADSAAAIGISTGRLVKILARDPDLWGKVNSERRKRGMSVLSS